MSSGNVVRIVAVLGAAIALIGSAQNSQNPSQANQAQYSQSQAGGSPPPPQEMESSRALGVWRSTFGAVKIEADNSRGGLETGSLQGVWVYQRQGQEVVGYFSGSLRGNVLEFKWQEPNNPPLTGSGYLVFDRSGRQYSGRWWSDRRDRVGDWNGWRNSANETPNRAPNPDDGDPYGGAPYGGSNPGSEPTTPYGPRQPQPQPRRPAPRPQPQPQPQPGTYGPQPPPPNYY